MADALECGPREHSSWIVELRVGSWNHLQIAVLTGCTVQPLSCQPVSPTRAESAAGGGEVASLERQRHSQRPSRSSGSAMARGETLEGVSCQSCVSGRYPAAPLVPEGGAAVARRRTRERAKLKWPPVSPAAARVSSQSALSRLERCQRESSVRIVFTACTRTYRESTSMFRVGATRRSCSSCTVAGRVRVQRLQFFVNNE